MQSALGSLDERVERALRWTRNCPSFYSAELSNISPGGGLGHLGMSQMLSTRWLVYELASFWRATTQSRGAGGPGLPLLRQGRVLETEMDYERTGYRDGLVNSPTSAVGAEPDR